MNINEIKKNYNTLLERFNEIADLSENLTFPYKKRLTFYPKLKGIAISLSNILFEMEYKLNCQVSTEEVFNGFRID